MALKTITRQELLADMGTGIGGSECHHLFGLPPYGCRRLLWYIKSGAKPDFLFHGNRDTQRGTGLENLVAKLYAETTGRGLYKSHCVRNEDLPQWLCHPDRIIVRKPKNDPMRRQGPGILEVKCPSVQSFLQVRREGLRDNWIMQLQHSIGAAGFKWGSFAVFSAELWELVHFDMVKEPTVVETCKEAVSRFWRLVENGPPPDRLDAADLRCRKCAFRTQCQGSALLDALAAGQDIDPTEQLPVDNSLLDAAKAVHEARELLAEAKAIEEQAVDKLQTAMGNREAVQADGDWKIYYRAHQRLSWDNKGLAKDHPELAEKYQRASVVRPLKVLFTK